SAKRFGAAALFGSTMTFSVYPSFFTTAATGPGPTFASAPFSCPRNFDGGARLVSTAAAATAPTRTRTSVEVRTARSEGAGGPPSGRTREGTSRGRLTVRLTAAMPIATASNEALTMMTCPYDVVQSAERIGRWSTEAQIPEPRSTARETSATFENRGTTTATPATRRPGASVPH